MAVDLSTYWKNYDPETGIGDPSTPLAAQTLNEWGADVEQIRADAETYRNQAQEAAEQAAAPTDGQMAAALSTPGSASRTTADDLYAAPVGVDSARYVEADTGLDVSADLQAALNAAQAAGAFGAATLTLRPGEYIVGSPVTVPDGVTLRGLTGAVLVTQGNTHILTLSSRVTIEGVTFRGTNPVGGAATLTGQYGINAVGVPGARLHDITIRGCRFEGIEYAAARIRHTDRFRVESCTFLDTGYSAVQIGCAADGLVIGNFFRGTGVLPTYAVNSYAVSMSLDSGPIDPVSNPQPTRITVSNNVVTSQAWEALDTHGGTEITFANNIIVGCESGIAAVIRGGVTGTAPQHIVVTGNVIDGTGWPTVTKRFGIAVNGESSGPTYGRAVITGNSVSNMGISKDHPAQWSPAGAAIMLTNQASAVVSGNHLHNTLGSGVSARACQAVVISSNIIDGVWREAGDTSRLSSAVYLSNHTGVAQVIGNLLTGGAGLSNPNERAIQQSGGAGTVRDLDNEWGAAPNENVATGWSSYTPALSGITLGDGNVSAKWTRSGNGGKTVTFVAVITAGSTTSITGTLGVGLPVPAATASQVLGSGYRSSPNGVVGLRGSSTTEVFVYDAATGGAWGSGTAFPAGATLRITGTYEAA